MLAHKILELDQVSKMSKYGTCFTLSYVISIQHYYYPFIKIFYMYTTLCVLRPHYVATSCKNNKSKLILMKACLVSYVFMELMFLFPVPHHELRLQRTCSLFLLGCDVTYIYCCTQNISFSLVAYVLQEKVLKNFLWSLHLICTFEQFFECLLRLFSFSCI